MPTRPTKEALSKRIEDLELELHLLRKENESLREEARAVLNRKNSSSPFNPAGTHAQTQVQLSQFIAIIDNFAEFLYVSDPRTNEILLVNKKLEEALGGSPVGKICHREFQGQDLPCDFCTNHLLRGRKEPYVWEFYNKKLKRDYLIIDQMIRWPDGRDVRFEVAIDITERKRSEERIRAYAQKLEWSNRELRDFAHVASHDLQEPLRKIQIFADLFAGKYEKDLDDQGRDYLRRMRGSANRMQCLIRELLKYSKVTHTPSFEDVDLNEVSRVAISNLEARIRETQGIIEVDPLPVLRADYIQMVQLFQNILSNALKFHKPGEKPRIKVYSKKIGIGSPSSYQILFEDNCIGFDEKYLHKIFQPFEKLHHGEWEGFGMGLTICRKIAERHCGSITAKSVPGKGSTFVVRLPHSPVPLP
jgi:signal transduction histidine kinase